VGDDSLVGVLSTPPVEGGDGTSWLGCPAIELPRVPDRADPARTVSPPRRLVAARAAVELVRVLLPGTVSVVLAAGVYGLLDAIGRRTGSATLMVAAAPLALTAAGVCAALFTIAAKWIVMGRYRVAEHPLWSFFVWRDELLNTCQEQVSGPWLIRMALGTPVMRWYLRALGARIGRDTWIDTLNVTEFDLVDVGDGCALNRGSCLETHLFHDRLMRTGPARLGAGATLGPCSAVLPDTALGAGTSVGGRSFVLRGEELPAHTRWHGAPVVAA
jgi:non-ribosomal peptide synthetase-like protein